jgi:hypothetical protein
MPANELVPAAVLPAHYGLLRRQSVWPIRHSDILGMPKADPADNWRGGEPNLHLRGDMLYVNAAKYDAVPVLGRVQSWYQHNPLQ